MDLEQKINLLLSYEGSKKNWKNIHDSEQWILANEVASIVMGEGLNRTRNCGCLNDLFYMIKNISKSKIKLKQLQMENEFELKPGILLFINGTHYSNANITDSVSLEILKNFPVKINAFVKYPKNWKELCEANAKGKKAVKNEAPKSDEEIELRKLSDSDLKDLCNKLAEETEGLKKINHKAGTDKMVAYLLENKVNG
jgi:hypothetical protein